MASKFNLLFLGFRKEWEVEYLEERAAGNLEVNVLAPDADEAAVQAACQKADVIIPWKIRFTAEMISDCPRLKLVQALSAGVDYLPVAELNEHGIAVANNSGSNAIAVAEATVFLIVATYRQLQVQMNQLYDGDYQGDFFDRWEDFHELTGKQVGIVGFGPIGSAVARRLQGWDCKVVYFDVVEVSKELEQKSAVERVELDELLSTSDVVTLHVPLTSSTRGMISDDQFQQMKQSAIIINTTRGPVIDEAAMIRALDADEIAGAGIDVTEIEPIEASNRLKGRNNVVLTPHLAGLSIEARHRALEFAISNANRIAAGETPVSLIDHSYH